MQEAIFVTDSWSPGVGFFPIFSQIVKIEKERRFIHNNIWVLREKEL